MLPLRSLRGLFSRLRMGSAMTGEALFDASGERRMIVFRHGDGERVDLYRCPPGCREHAGCMVKPRVTSTTIGDRRVWQVECSCLRYKGGIVGRFLSWDAAMDAAVVHVRWFHHQRQKIMAALTGAPMVWSNREETVVCGAVCDESEESRK